MRGYAQPPFEFKRILALTITGFSCVHFNWLFVLSHWREHRSVCANHHRLSRWSDFWSEERIPL